MSDPGVDADLTLDITAALDEVQRLQRSLDQAVSDLTATIVADTSTVAGDVTTAVDQADTDVTVDADTAAVPSEVSSAVDAADGTFDVDADTAGVPGEIGTAVDTADGSVDVDADTAGVPNEISRAVDGADASLDVDADTRSAQAQINALQRRLTDAESESAELRRELDRLGDEGEQTSQGLQVDFRAVAAVISGALAGAFVQAGIEFNTLQQTSRAALETLLGGAQEATAQMEELNQFADQSPFPREQFIEAQQTLIAFGVAAEDTVPTLNAIEEALAASGQSSDQISEIARVFGQIQSAGRITAEELNQFAERGVNAAQLIGDQMGLTAGEIREQITAGALDAEAALTALRTGMEEEFEGAAASVRSTFTVARDRVRSALRDISADLFATFVDPQGGGAAVDFFNQLADEMKRFQDEAGPAISALGGGLAPVLSSIGSDLLPAVTTSLIELTPLLGGTTSLLQGLVPLFEVLGAGLEAIPGPALQMATAFAVLNRLNVGARLQSIGTLAAVAGLELRDAAGNARSAGGAFGVVRAGARTAGGAIRGMASAIGPAGIATAGLAVGMTLLAQRQQEAAQDAQNHRERVDILRQAIQETESVAEGLELGLQRMAEGGDESAQGLADVGVSAEDFRTTALGAANETEAVASLLRQAGADADLTGDQIDGLANDVTGGESAWERFQGTISDLGIAGAGDEIEGLGDQHQETAEHARDQVNALNAYAQEQFTAARLSGELTDAQIDQVQSADNTAEAWFRVEAQLENTEAVARESINTQAVQARNAGNLSDAQLRQVESAEDAAAAEQVLADATAETGSATDAANRILEEHEGATGAAAAQARDVAAALRQVDGVMNAVESAADNTLAPFQSLTSELGNTGVNMDEVDGASEALELSLGELALAIDDAGLSGDELAAIADDLGVTVADLEGFISSVVGVVEDFQSAAESSIPTVSDALSDLDDITLSGIQESVSDTLDSIEQFADDIELLSIRPQIQRLALEEGPELARVLAQAQEDGNEAQLDEIEEGLGDIRDARQGLIDDARTFALEFAVSMGIIAEQGVERFGEIFDIESPTLEAMNDAEDVIAQDQGGMVPETSRLSRRIVEVYGQGIEGMVPETSRTTRNTVEAYRSGLSGMIPEASRISRTVTQQYGSGVEGMIPETSRSTRRSIDVLELSEPGFGSAGLGDGSAVVGGFSSGISPMSGTAGNEADQAVFAVAGRAGPGRGSGVQVGGSIKGGVEAGISGTATSVANEAKRAAAAPRGVSGYGAAFGVGSSIADGMAAGVRGGAARVESAARAAANAAIAAAGSALGIASPSKVFETIGGEVGEGLRLGILEQVDPVEQAANDLVGAVAGVDAPTIPVGRLDPAVERDVTSRGGFGDTPGAGGVTNAVTVAAGAVQINIPAGTSPAGAEELGERAGRGFLQTLAQRRVQVAARTAR